MEWDAVQVRYAEYADNPLVFDRLPDWLSAAVERGAIRPVFAGEDYWRLRVDTPGAPTLAVPGDWLVLAGGRLHVAPVSAGACWCCQPGAGA